MAFIIRTTALIFTIYIAPHRFAIGLTNRLKAIICATDSRGTKQPPFHKEIISISENFFMMYPLNNELGDGL